MPKTKYLRYRKIVGLGCTLIVCCPTVYAQIIPPFNVPGKEYSNHGDEDFLGVIDFLQNIGWNGFGTAVNAFDYSGSGPPPLDPDQVDALANHQDWLFHQVANGTAPFVASFGGIGDIYSHNTGGQAGLWAHGPTDINTLSPPDDVDGLELWGDPNSPQHNGLGGFDANHFSLYGDSIGPAISVFGYDPILHRSSAYIFHNQVQAALDTQEEVDIDALMVFDLQGDGAWNVGDTIMFSVHPTAQYDGGEIWVWSNGSPAQFLVHGGRTWDTANPVGQIFGVNTENINAFEGVIPSQGALVLLAVAGLVTKRRRR